MWPEDMINFGYPTRYEYWRFKFLDDVHFFPYQTAKLIPTVNGGTMSLHNNAGE